MWKTRFEVNTPTSEQKPLRSVSRSYSSQTTPTVPRMREDSPSALVRPSPPSSTPNLPILTEDDAEDTEQLPVISLVRPKYNNNNSYPTMSKHSVVLPTIIESHDQELLLLDVPINRTNSERPSRAVPIDTRIHDIRHKPPRSREERSFEFKEISAFFESKASIDKPKEQKRILRAKRTLRRLGSTGRHVNRNTDQDDPSDELDQKRILLRHLGSLVMLFIVILAGYSCLLQPTNTHLLVRNRFFALFTLSMEHVSEWFTHFCRE